MNMKDMIQRMTDIEAEKQQLNENEAGMPPMGAPMSAPAMDQGNPVTINVSMNASGKEHVADLLDMMKNAGLNDAEPVSAKTLSPRLDMERLAGIMDDPKIPGKDDVEGDKDLKQAHCNDIENDDEPVEEFANSPEGSAGDPEYKDHHHMTKDLSGGINRKKKQYKAAQPGDNAMAMEDIKSHLYNLLAEKKAKPDYIDIDGDGDKKEPMKKAVKDKKAKKTNEAKKEFEKTGQDGDGSKTFDEAGCKSEMKKLDASGCAKHEMYEKMKKKYGCDKGTFEKLYASSCS